MSKYKLSNKNSQQPSSSSSNPSSSAATASSSNLPIWCSLSSPSQIARKYASIAPIWCHISRPRQLKKKFQSTFNQAQNLLTRQHSKDAATFAKENKTNSTNNNNNNNKKLNNGGGGKISRSFTTNIHTTTKDDQKNDDNDDDDDNDDEYEDALEHTNNNQQEISKQNTKIDMNNNNNNISTNNNNLYNSHKTWSSSAYGSDLNKPKSYDFNNNNNNTNNDNIYSSRLQYGKSSKRDTSNDRVSRTRTTDLSANNLNITSAYLYPNSTPLTTPITTTTTTSTQPLLSSQTGGLHSNSRWRPSDNYYDDLSTKSSQLADIPSLSSHIGTTENVITRRRPHKYGSRPDGTFAGSKTEKILSKSSKSSPNLLGDSRGGGGGNNVIPDFTNKYNEWNNKLHSNNNNNNTNNSNNHLLQNQYHSGVSSNNSASTTTPTQYSNFNNYSNNYYPQYNSTMLNNSSRLGTTIGSNSGLVSKDYYDVDPVNFKREEKWNELDSMLGAQSALLSRLESDFVANRSKLSNANNNSANLSDSSSTLASRKTPAKTPMSSLFHYNSSTGGILGGSNNNNINTSRYSGSGINTNESAPNTASSSVYIPNKYRTSATTQYILNKNQARHQQHHHNSPSYSGGSATSLTPLKYATRMENQDDNDETTQKLDTAPLPPSANVATVIVVPAQKPTFVVQSKVEPVMAVAAVAVGDMIKSLQIEDKNDDIDSQISNVVDEIESEIHKNNILTSKSDGNDEIYIENEDNDNELDDINDNVKDLINFIETTSPNSITIPTRSELKSQKKMSNSSSDEMKRINDESDSVSGSNSGNIDFVDDFIDTYFSEPINNTATLQSNDNEAIILKTSPPTTTAATANDDNSNNSVNDHFLSNISSYNPSYNNSKQNSKNVSSEEIEDNNNDSKMNSIYSSKKSSANSSSNYNTNNDSTLIYQSNDPSPLNNSKHYGKKNEDNINSHNSDINVASSSKIIDQTGTAAVEAEQTLLKSQTSPLLNNNEINLDNIDTKNWFVFIFNFRFSILKFYNFA
jgi:hypothetical protein